MKLKLESVEKGYVSHSGREQRLPPGSNVCTERSKG